MSSDDNEIPKNVYTSIKKTTNYLWIKINIMMW